MYLDPSNFLTHIKGLVTGGGRDANNNPAIDSGFLRDTPNLIGESVLATSVTRITDSDGFPALNAAASITAVANVSFRIPRDYDEATDILIFRYVAKMGGATDVPAVTAAVKARVTGAAATTPTIASGTTSSALSATAAETSVVLRGRGFVRGQEIELTLTSAAHTTDALQVQSISASYHSTLVSYNTATSAGVDLR